MNYVANILDEEGLVFPDLVKQGNKVDEVLYRFDGYGLPLHDEGEAPLYLCYGTEEGGTVLALNAPDEAEVERRIIRCLGLDVVIDCIEESAEQARLDEPVVIVVRHPDYSDDIKSFFVPAYREVYIDLGSQFDSTPDDAEEALEWAASTWSEVSDLPKGHPARNYVLETITNTVEDYFDGDSVAVIAAEKPYLLVKVDNVYSDGHESSHHAVAAAPDADDMDDLEEWASRVLFDLTGDGHGTDSDLGSCYTVTILTAADLTLVGKEFEWVD